jgi:hypothetical protein
VESPSQANRAAKEAFAASNATAHHVAAQVIYDNTISKAAGSDVLGAATDDPRLCNAAAIVSELI